MEIDILALLIEYGPIAIALLIGAFIPADKLPILKKFLGKTVEEVNKEEDTK